LLRSKILNSKDTTQNIDQEFDRVLSNPDNLIISDSLEGMVDFDLAEDPDVWGVSNFTCHFTFGDVVIAGALKGLIKDSKEQIITIVASDDQAIKMISAGKLTGYVCKTIYDDVVDSRQVDTDIGYTISFDDENHCAEVSVIIPHEIDK